MLQHATVTKHFTAGQVREHFDSWRREQPEAIRLLFEAEGTPSNPQPRRVKRAALAAVAAQKEAAVAKAAAAAAAKEAAMAEAVEAAAVMEEEVAKHKVALAARVATRVAEEAAAAAKKATAAEEAAKEAEEFADMAAVEAAIKAWQESISEAERAEAERAVSPVSCDSDRS